MTFSVAQMEAVSTKITSGMKDLRDKIGKIEPAAVQAANHWYVPPEVGKALIWMAKQAVKIAVGILDTLIDIIQGLTAPFLFWQDAEEWSNIKAKAETIASDIGQERISSRLADGNWSGSAADKYKVAAAPQATAATRISAIADTMKSTLQAAAAAGFVFYVAIGFILYKFISAVVSMIAEFGFVISSLFGVATILEEAGTTPLAIAAAISGLGAFLAPQIEGLINAGASLESGAGFDRGHWPSATTRTYNDATVKDGDADWSANS